MKIIAAFIPKRDITPYEVAVILTCMHREIFGSADRIKFSLKEWDTLKPTIKRHFYRIN